MSEIDLTVKLANGLTLEDPFWIASSHLTQKSMLKVWKEIEPSALTLKTATKMDRNENKTPGGNRPTLDVLPRYGRSYYCDGLKKDEFHTYEECLDHLVTAKGILPKTKIGVSVLATEFENFGELRELTKNADFAELNLKYSMRVTAGNNQFSTQFADKWARCLALIDQFLKAYADFPVFIKISREMAWLPGSSEYSALIKLLTDHAKAGLVVANSRKMDIAKFIYEGEEKEFKNGVMTGEILYDETIKLIELFRNDVPNQIPIIATGGMVDEQQVLMALKSGADAVQLCTAFTYYKPGYYRTLVSGLKARMKWRGVTTAEDFISRLRDEGVASIYSMPFVYYSAFWGEDLQKQIRIDIRFSDRMDAVIMSGNTVTEQWEEPLRARVAAHKSVKFMLSNPNGDAFLAIQKSWGIVDKELEEAKRHVTTARTRLENMFTQTISLEEERKKIGLQVSYYDRCPFYSLYLFDDKAYLAQYPFHRPDRLASPVYVFFRSSPEYDRLDREWQGLETSVKLTKQD